MLMVVKKNDDALEYVRKFLVLLSAYKGEDKVLFLNFSSHFTKLARELKK
jgi:hypothetical protein